MSGTRYEISVETSFAASHQLRDYGAPLEPLHGHNFRVEVFVASESLPDTGYIVDFLELEAMLKEVVAPYDHRHMNDLAPFDVLNPTTENMARFFFDEMEKKLLRGVGGSVRLVRVWEAPTYSASYGVE